MYPYQFLKLGNRSRLIHPIVPYEPYADDHITKDNAEHRKTIVRDMEETGKLKNFIRTFITSNSKDFLVSKSLHSCDHSRLL